MKNILKCGALLATFIILAVLPARADSGATYSFDLSGPDCGFRDDVRKSHSHVF
jgi:hypothetical protein